MGMTIEKIIKKLLWFEDYNEDTYCGGDRIQDEYGEWFYKVTEEDFEAFRQAADIMRKYQKLEQEPTTKNDLGVTSGLEKNSKKLEKNFGELDCISREQALKELKESAEHHVNDSREEVLLRRDRDIIRALPSVTPQEPQTFKWCDTCKEYDQEKHCCHRWSKVIRDTVDEMKQEQEPILDKIDEIITDALDKSSDQKESQTLRWVLDKISEVT